jgi:class 3 adenylate cyclase
MRRFTGGSAADLDRTVRTDASIVFADLVGFTPRSEHMSAEEVMDTVRCLFELSVPVLARHRVQPLSYRGDGLLACARGEDHERRALAFAREFTRRAARATAVRHAMGRDWGLDVRAGVASGPVVLGVLGTLFKLEYVVNGRTANLAARLQSSAKPNEVVCDAHVAACAGLEPTEELALKGLAAPVSACRIAVGLVD